MNANTIKTNLENQDQLAHVIESVSGIKWIILALMESPNPVENSSLSVIYDALESTENTIKAIS